MIFFGLLDLFYDYPLDFGSIIHPQFFFLYMGYFDSVYSIKDSASSIVKLDWDFFPHLKIDRLNHGINFTLL